ncbi:hypothetical protein PODOV005v1_10028 [Vibrio phage PS32B.2]|nr:hypothetical protein PODOV005v1_10028 [Vibrio phage PS32B.2]QZI86330.1 hypothetical protein PODOV028v1_10039 [Vibrio phage PS32B.3]QZI86367.1 hypothetical protein PODOV029v1_10014 [Vibrio phage PS35B.1]QZI86424.1 hypothetical protein PODOV027v1_10015 [Vibrio phage PS35B.3]QZI92219.1 hypothetical protein PODOV026v1_p0046 [Vibrio phage PS32B.1]QZI92343.1 hypothetical protein PODOV025v1_p0046 [Vibrio phage PS32B.6]
MADLRQFQDRSQTQANLSAVTPVVPPSTTTFEQLGSFLQGTAPTVMGAVQAGQQAEAKLATDTNLGKFATSLANAQQASQLDPKSNLPAIQRKLYTEFVAANPSLGQDALKVFNDATGLKVAGMSSEQKAMQDMQETAWKSGFGSPTASAEENAIQLALYQNIERESKTMDFNAKVDSHNKTAKLKELHGSTAKLATWKTESLDATLQADLLTLKNGGSREEMEAKWAKLRVDWANELAQFGEFANDPTIRAQLTGIESMFDLANKMVTGQLELDALTKESETALAKQKALLTSDPAAAQLIAVSNFFGNTPSAQLPVAAYVSEVIDKGPSDIREVPGEEKATAKKTLESMSGSEDLATREEATGQVVSIAEHLDRNGMDYTDENILEVCSVLAVPKAFDGMTTGQKDLVKTACDTYAVDVAQKAIREIEQNGSVAFPTEVITPQGDTRPGAAKPIPVQDFATISADNTGLRYSALPEYRNNRQVQRRIQDLNRQLTKVNPVLEVYAAATGETPAYIATELWGLGPQGRSQADIAAERDLPASTEVDATVNPDNAPATNSDDFRTGFLAEAIAQGSTQEEAEELWEQISTPSDEALVDIGGVKMTQERARQLLSQPAR